jgi:putative membrane protein
MPSSLLMTLERSSAQSTSPDQAEIAERRTSMAADRMLMAWVRTSLSLFSFGFTLYRIFLKDSWSLVRPCPVTLIRSVRGIILVVLGVLAFLMGITD